MATTPRHVYGPRPVSALVPRLTRPAFKRLSPATAQIMIDWAGIVGPALAAVTSPQRLAAGQLTIACSGPIAMELQHLAPEVIGRINAHFGAPTVRTLRFVQKLAPAAAAAAPPASIASRAAERAEASVAGLPAGELRNSLASLGRAVLAATDEPQPGPATPLHHYPT